MQKKNIFPINAQFFLFIALLLTQGFSCTGTKKTATRIEHHDFTSELIGYAENKFTFEDYKILKKKHGRFFQLWQNEILDFGKLGNSDSAKFLAMQHFLDVNKPAFAAVKLHYKKYPQLQDDIADGFENLHAILPQLPIPAVYSYFSQFSNYTTFNDTSKNRNMVAYSSEMFMDDTFVLYKLLEVEEFMNRYNSTVQIPAMLVWNYVKSQYEDAQPGQKMIDEMVFNGKVWYTLSKAFPDKKPHELFGYTEAEWKVLMTDEGQIWRHYLTQNMLFNSDFSAYKRYFNYGNKTFGAGIPENVPPMIGYFSGYRIIERLAKEKNLNLVEIWKLKDGSKVLQMSGYNPVK